MPITMTVPRLSYRKIILADNPIGYWRLGEQSGTTAFDETGNFNGTYVNSPTLGVNGLINDNNTAVTFGGNASQEYINTNWSGGILGSNARSVECWFTTTDSRTDLEGGCFTSWGDPGTGEKFIFRIEDGRPKIETGGVNHLIWNLLINDGITHHIVITYPNGGNVSDVKCYVDNTELGTYDLEDTAINTISNINVHIATDPISSGAQDRYFDGTLDEVAIYDYVLTPTQITKHYNTGI